MDLRHDSRSSKRFLPLSLGLWRRNENVHVVDRIGVHVRFLALKEPEARAAVGSRETVRDLSFRDFFIDLCPAIVRGILQRAAVKFLLNVTQNGSGYG